jgi:ATP-dependent Zn protease
MVVSEEYKTLIDTEVNKILKDSYNRVKDLIKHNRKEIELLVKELVEHETLSIEQIKRLLRIV